MTKNSFVADVTFKLSLSLSLSFRVYKYKRESTQPEYICDIVLETAKSRVGTVTRISD